MGAARKWEIDCFVTMDGDDLLCEPELMTIGIEQLKLSNADFIEAPTGLICGSFTYGIKTPALEKVCHIKGTDDTEMMWVYFKDTRLFNVATLDVKDVIFYETDIRMTLDYAEDFDFFNAIFTHFDCVDNDVPLRTIVPYLKNNQEIIKINAFRHQDWAANQKKKTKLLLKDG